MVFIIDIALVVVVEVVYGKEENTLQFYRWFKNFLNQVLCPGNVFQYVWGKKFCMVMEGVNKNIIGVFG